MTFREVFSVKGSLEQLAQVETSFGASLALNRLVLKVYGYTEPFEKTLKPYQEKGQALGAGDGAAAMDEKTRKAIDALNGEVDAELDKDAKGATEAFKGLELKAADWAEKAVKPAVIFPLFKHGLIQE